ncbi:cyclic nucleotide-binding protein [Trypanosoma grayi]|uniref:cyclic nucleotide-binding protein n=1 Tax=Trypanosoma grayi TaxID=71804 RepID=UPI0004F46990|nr:cyclic nucleotide-binding protein [Trypanosoma grayi]KEG06468.1 cyclic nucleotide-binding protein [Trypanosoma grayi]
MDFLRNSLTIGNDASDAAVKSVLSQLPFSEREVEGLLQVWEGPHVIKMLYNILLQHEEFVVYIDVNMSKKFTQDPYVNCCLSISRHIKAELGLSEEESLPDDLIIDIIFSPNTTIKNLLCSASDDFRQMLEMCDEWRTVSSTLTNPDDCYLYVLSQVLEQGETVRELYRQRLEASGFIMMEDTAGSALAVDLINVSKLCVSDMDASLRAAVPIKEEARGRSFIINVDGTFGAQIEAILRNLNLTFGKYIRSVNVSGSVAGLVGKRGDVVLPTKLLFSKQTFGEDSTDETRLCNEGSITEEDVLPFLGKDTVALHRGGCVTIPGIILYSDSVLRFYKVVHCCTAVDMRSSYVARQMEESRRTEILKKGLIKRFLFYMDSVPLSEEDDTGSSSQVTEILFSVYATTRSLLNLILSS